MKTSYVSIFLFCLSFLLVGCNSSKIFYATFESDTVGNLPNEDPPESPAGDLIYTSAGGSSASGGSLEVINADVLSSGKTLLYRNVNIPLWYRYVGFVSKEVSWEDDRTIYAYWTGSIDLDPSGSSLRIWIGNGHFLPLALLEFNDGDIRLQTGTGSNSSFETLGSFNENSSHTIILNVDKATQTYAISIIQGGRAGNLNTGSRPVLNTDALETERPTLYMWFNEDLSGSGSYEIDEITISKENPES